MGKRGLFQVLLLGVVFGNGVNCVLPPDTWVNRDVLCQTTEAQALCDAGDEFACRWAALVKANLDSTAIAPLLGLPSTSTQDEILTTMFPKLAGVSIFSGSPTDASEVTLDIRDTFEPVTVSLPIDWTISPYADPSWELYFLSLNWLNTVPPSLAGKILIQWVEEMLPEETPPRYVWNDHAVSIRIERVAAMISAYIDEENPVSREVLWAAVKVITTHLYALATQKCYTKFHNHGVMQDRAVLLTLLKFPTFVDSNKLWTLVGDRLSEQVRAAVTSEGVHAENSPGYHLLFWQLVHGLSKLFGEGEQPVPTNLTAVYPQMSAVMVYLLQPNLTFPQFGDTENDALRDQLLYDVTTHRANGVSDVGLDYLEWVASRGQSGTIPPHLDQVWPLSGYAAFRNNWTDHDDAITGHFTCAKLSNTHYHKDETSISLYGYGQELIVDPGILSYRWDSLSLYSRSGTAHNTLTVDDTEHVSGGDVSIISSGGVDTTLAWVRGGHSHYADLGVQSLARTFAHSKPDVFLVVDHLRSPNIHRLAQHFLLHPSLSQVTQPTPGTIVASSDDPGTPSVVISSLPGVTMEVHRGVLEEEQIFGWYFPEFNVIEEATEIVIRSDFTGGQVDLPILIHVVAPGESTSSALETFENTAGELRLGWRTAAGSDSAIIPAPTP